MFRVLLLLFVCTESFKIRCDIFRIILDLMGFFLLPYEFRFFLKKSCKECHGNLNRDWICELHSAIIFFSIWILPIHVHGMPFYLLVHFISFFSGLKFQLKRSVLANFMPTWLWPSGLSACFLFYWQHLKWLLVYSRYLVNLCGITQ